MNSNDPVELRMTAASHREHAKWCLGIERQGWLNRAEEMDRRASMIENAQSATIHVNTFVRRQTEASGFSHWKITDDELVARVMAGLPNARRGYREGVLLVPVEPDGFFSGVCELKDGDHLIGDYKPRRPGEEPRKSCYAAKGQKLPAAYVEIVVYSHAALADGKENETEADYEVISVNARHTVHEEPIQPDALIANHLGLSGGTATRMTDEEFVAALRVSVGYWMDKAMAVPQELKPFFGIPNKATEQWMKETD